MSRKHKKKGKKNRSLKAGFKTAGTSPKSSLKRKIGGLPILIDGEPIRRAARQAHEKARAQLETIERQFAQFERQELPAYQRWMHLTFGPLITKLRETESAIESKEDILERVEAYQIWENMSPAYAYARVKSEMENPGRDSETENKENDFDGLDDESEDFLRDAYEAASAAFKQESGFEAPDFESFKETMGIGGKPSAHVKEEDNSEKARIKKLYRKIARHLHPDCSETFSLREQRLWHRAQEAYKNGDAVALETVLSHIEAAESGPLFACVSDLMQNTKEMLTRVNYLEEDLYEARQHPAWRFTQKTQTQLASLKKRVEKEINRSIDQARRDLALAEADLQQLELAYTRMVARKNKSRKRRETAPTARQASFDF